MPKLGLTMEEGQLVEWRVAPGDRVGVGDILFVVETDKIESEIEASEAGVVESLLAEQGAVVAVGAAVATLEVEDAEVDAATADASRPAGPGPAAESAQAGRAADGPSARVPAPAEPAPDRSGARIVATPRARRLARDAGLDLAGLRGSGPRGRIVARDVSAAAAAGGPARAPEAAEPKPSAAPAPAPAPEDSARAADAPPSDSDTRGTHRPLTRLQRLTAQRLAESKREIPHFYIFAEADVTALLALRAERNAAGESDAAGALPKLSVNHFLVAAMARALAQLPAFNAVWDDGRALDLAQVDVGIAVETDRGLVAPVLRDLAESGAHAIARAAGDLVERARARKLMPNELRGGATTVSNVGMFGATGLLPIVNPGQSSILGVGRNRAVFRPDARGQPELRQVLDLALSCDHRVIDGALAARFLQRVQAGLEDPNSLL